MEHITVNALKVTGFRKKETGGGCEDALKVLPFSKGQILAAADGHGDLRCKYASVGAALACESAVRVLASYAARLGRRSPSEFWNENRNAIAKEIMLSFRHAVLDDFTARYPDYASEKERLHGLIDASFEREKVVLGAENAEREAKRADRDRLSKIVFLYGTTLRASVLSEGYVFNLAVGDGDTVALLANGEAVWLIPKGEAFDTRTESMCEEPRTLLECFYFSFLPLKSRKKTEDSFDLCTLVLCTDGLRNSFFSDTGYTDFLFSASKRLKERGKSYTRTLRRRLETLTRNSCYGDDITLLMAYKEEM